MFSAFRTFAYNKIIVSIASEKQKVNCHEHPVTHTQQHTFFIIQSCFMSSADSGVQQPTRWRQFVSDTG